MSERLQKYSKAAPNVLVYIILCGLGILWVLPILYLIYTAFRVTPSTGIINQLIPKDLRLGFGNFIRLFRDTMFARWLGNTIVVSVADIYSVGVITVSIFEQFVH